MAKEQLVEAVTEAYLSEDGRLDLSVEGVKPRRQRDEMGLRLRMKI